MVSKIPNVPLFLCKGRCGRKKYQKKYQSFHYRLSIGHNLLIPAISWRGSCLLWGDNRHVVAYYLFYQIYCYFSIHKYYCVTIKKATFWAAFHFSRSKNINRTSLNALLLLHFLLMHHTLHNQHEVVIAKWLLFVVF